LKGGKKLEKLYSIKEASEYLKVSRVTLHKWINTGKVKYVVSPLGAKKFTENQLKNVYKEV